MNLNADAWKWFNLKEIFGNCKKGIRITVEDRIKGTIPFVTAGEFNEGVSEYISNEEAETFKNSLTIDMFGNCFYHDYEFKCDDNILVITNDFINPLNGIFLANVIACDKYRFNYGRQYRKKDYNKHAIKLPVDSNGDPNWQFMEDYIKSLNHKPITTSNKNGGGLSSLTLGVSEWKEFSLRGISNVYTGGDLILSMVDDGEIPVATHKVENNGVGAMVDKIENRLLFDCKKTIALADRGCFHASVQTDDFYIGTRVKALEIKCCVSVEVLVFIATIINLETFKYNYGRNCTSGVENVRVKLPVKHNADGTIFIDDKHMYSEEGYIPDWQFMEDYIKSLPYGDRI